MAVLIRYHPTNLTRERYDKINDFFMQAEAPPEPPQALHFHVVFGEEDNLKVGEVWESEAAWRELYDGGMLGQALDSAGVERDPEVLPVQDFWGSGVPSPPPPPA